MRLLLLFRWNRPAKAKARHSAWRPTLEALEDRTTPSTLPTGLYILPTPPLMHVRPQPPSRFVRNTAVGPIVAHTLGPVVLAPSLGMTAVSWL